MSNLTIGQNNAVADYVDHTGEDGGGAGEDAHCCCPGSTPSVEPSTGHAGGSGIDITVPQLVVSPDGTFYLQTPDGQFQPVYGSGVEGGGGDATNDTVDVGTTPPDDGMEIEVDAHDGSSAPTTDASTGAAHITPEEKRQAGADYLQSRVDQGMVLSADGQPDPARAEMLLAKVQNDPRSAEAVGEVYLTALEMSGGSVEYAERAADVFVVNVGSSLGNADKAVSLMLQRGMAGDPAGIDVETFVELAHDGEFLTSLLGMLAPDENGRVSPEGEAKAKAFFDERVGRGTEAPEDGYGEVAADGGAEEVSVTQAGSTEGVADAAFDSGDAVVDQYLGDLVGKGLVTDYQATMIAGDATVVANLGALLQLDEQGEVATTDVSAVDTLMTDVLAAIGDGEPASSDEGIAGTDTADENAVGGNAGIEGSGEAAESVNTSNAGTVDDYLAGKRDYFHGFMTDRGVSEEIADELLDELYADDGFRAGLEPHLARNEQGDIVERPTEDSEASLPETMVLGELDSLYRERAAESNGGEPNANEGSSAPRTNEERQQEQQQFVQGGEQAGEFLGFGEERGRQLGGGAYNAYDGFFGENTNFAQGGTGVDQLAGGFGLNTDGAFGHVGNIYEGGNALFDGDASLGERVNGGIQLVNGGIELGETFGLWGGDDDGGSADDDFDYTDFGADDVEIGTYVPDDDPFASGDTEIGTYVPDSDPIADLGDFEVDGYDDGVEIGTYVPDSDPIADLGDFEVDGYDDGGIDLSLDFVDGGDIEFETESVA